ncbi:MAG TPA: glycosyltransferase family 4 protein [Chthoniobacterales bacterium]
MSALSVLSFGFTRGLWDGPEAEDVQRMKSYAEQLERYVVVTNSYRRHRLQRHQLAPNFEAIPTNGFTPVDSFIRMLGLGRGLLRTRKIDVLQAQDPFFCGLAAVILGKLFRRPVVVCVFGPNVYDPNWVASHPLHRLLAPVGRWVLAQCACIQVDGAMTARSLTAAGISPERIELKPIVPTNLERFLAIERTGAARAVTRLLFVGRLCSQKNLPLLLETILALRKRTRAPFELRIIGAGTAEPELRAIVEREQLQDCVTLRSPVPRDLIADEFAAADIFVLSSDYEGYPRVLMEAAAAALPIVSTAISGSDEAIVDGESGFIVPVRARDSLVEKLALLLEDPPRRLQTGLAGRRHIHGRIDPRTNAPRQLAIWRKAARAHQAPAEPTPSPDGERLLLFNLVTDARDPILGFTTQWIRELAARVSSIDVITMRAGLIDVPQNVRVHSVGKERGYSEPRRAFEFYRHLFRILRRVPITGCFSHMMPEFSALGGPVLRARGIPLVTWYAHPSLTLPLKLAHFFSNRMVTSLPNAYPYAKDKLAVIGQGIDTALFAPANEECVERDLVLCVGRISRVKNHATLLRAVALLPRRVRVVILGATAGADDEVYAAELRRLVDELQLGESVTFAPPVAREELPAHYRRCAVHVNLTPAGFGDKVAWEAMSCARPCLVANVDLRETLGQHARELLFRGDDPRDLAQKLESLLSKTPAEQSAIGFALRAQVERLHSLPRLAERILAELRSVSGETQTLRSAPLLPPETASVH